MRLEIKMWQIFGKRAIEQITDFLQLIYQQCQFATVFLCESMSMIDSQDFVPRAHFVHNKIKPWEEKLIFFR